MSSNTTQVKNLHEEDRLKEFDISFTGMSLGIHRFEYKIKSDFFKHFENDSFQNSAVHVAIDFDKRSNFFVLNFAINGWVKTECDRCLDMFNLTFSGDYEVIIKFANTSFEQADEDADLIYLTPGTNYLNVAQLIYEFILLCIPIKRVHPTDERGNSQCDPKILDILAGNETQEEENNDIIDPRWAILNKLKDNN